MLSLSKWDEHVGLGWCVSGNPAKCSIFSFSLSIHVQWTYSFGKVSEAIRNLKDKKFVFELKNLYSVYKNEKKMFYNNLSFIFVVISLSVSFLLKYFLKIPGHESHPLHN